MFHESFTSSVPGGQTQGFEKSVEKEIKNTFLMKNSEVKKKKRKSYVVPILDNSTLKPKAMTFRQNKLLASNSLKSLFFKKYVLNRLHGLVGYINLSGHNFPCYRLVFGVLYFFKKMKLSNF